MATNCVSEKIETKDPNKYIIRMTEAILEQHDMILKMNARLLDCFNNPPVVISGNEIADLSNTINFDDGMDD